MHTLNLNLSANNLVKQLNIIACFIITTTLIACGGSEQSGTQTEIATESPTGDNSNVETNGSTQNVLCDYFYSEYNDSDSVQTTSLADWTCTGTTRDIIANGIPDHDVGTFPNPANPNTIAEQSVNESLTLTPIQTSTATLMGGPRGITGLVLNGVKIDAGTGGSCDDSGDNCDLANNSGNWNIEALSQTTFSFGTDSNNAHVQPDGTYHYHGMPEGFITILGGNATTMTLIGWAADGFPIYARYGYSNSTDANSNLVVMTGSYQHVTSVSANRPSTDIYPLGTFAQDWEYVAGSGDLDECNGRFGVTPEFPDGIYHYYATDTYPFFQRCVKGAL
ncbi:YHYH protein [Pseudoalteromonas sp. CR1]|uniref:YHYH protein n=1 Tax=Pseudoalteromonas sp. CR1 TaxID=2861964 RepID=UPI001C5CE880|nr:YHYH protein [Pseudoalteromonas sp. CR1]MBW4965740.1 YHYH protein [Pseudoalteromonas sp. CR1]